MKTISMVVNGPNKVTDNVLPAYRIDLSITAANDITTKIFVKKRFKKYDGTLDDSFVAVASPTNLQDFAEDAPNEGQNYFRTNCISLQTSDVNYLNTVLQEILSDISLLLNEETVLDGISNQSITYTITPSSITTS